MVASGLLEFHSLGWCKADFRRLKSKFIVQPHLCAAHLCSNTGRYPSHTAATKQLRTAPQVFTQWHNLDVLSPAAAPPRCSTPARPRGTSLFGTSGQQCAVGNPAAYQGVTHQHCQPPLLHLPEGRPQAASATQLVSDLGWCHRQQLHRGRMHQQSANLISPAVRHTSPMRLPQLS